MFVCVCVWRRWCACGDEGQARDVIEFGRIVIVVRMGIFRVHLTCGRGWKYAPNGRIRCANDDKVDKRLVFAGIFIN